MPFAMWMKSGRVPFGSAAASARVPGIGLLMTNYVND
jgi:hypothetical protein